MEEVERKGRREGAVKEKKRGKRVTRRVEHRGEGKRRKRRRR